MSYGFDCDDGWFNLIWTLSQKIEDSARQAGLEPQSNAWPEAIQVKQKMGTLRFYLDNSTEAMTALICKAEEDSTKICEICGNSVSTMRGFGVKTLCNKHEQENLLETSVIRKTPVCDGKRINMPKNEKTSTLLRQWEMMRMLTVSRYDNKQDGRWDKASEITAKLNDAGYTVSVRTVQRDLKELSEIFPIELNDKNPRDYGWRWIKDANLNIPGMSVSEALAMRLVEMHLKQLLPTAMLDGLQGVFGLAKTKLDEVEKHNNNHSKDWLNKVRVVQPGQTLLPPRVNQDIQSDIYRAVLENHQLSVSYNAAGSKEIKEYVLHPLGIIMRGSVSYLVASAWDYPDARLYALHRFSKVTILDSAAKAPNGFNLDKAIACGFADFAHRGETIQLEIRCEEWVAAYLAETPLSADQTAKEEANGWIRLTATVNDTWQLRWWLMGQGAGIEVCAPATLRAEIKAALIDAVNSYA